MNRHTKMVAAIGLGAIAGALLLGAALASRPARTEWWTDGAAVRERADQAPVRRVLWSPSTPVTGAAGADVVDASVDEYEARISFDGSTMVFVRRRPGKNADLFTARRTPTGWTEASPIDAINTEHDELGPELSQDGTSLYFYSDRPGGLGGYDLWVSRAGGEGWGTPVNLGAAVNTGWNEYGPALSPDGATLYFSSNRDRERGSPAPPEGWSATLREERGRRDYDLYSSDLRSGEPAQAVAIDAINTDHDEGAPAVSPGGDFLYFASDRPGGLGGFDLWRARLLRGAVGAPENLGAAVNSAANDMDPGLSADGFRLYFSSDRGRDGAAGEAAAATATAERARYALWVTVSREVYSEFERTGQGKNLAAAWESVWPWLLLLVAMGLALYLLLRILRSEAWRRRIGQLSLLARCVLVSLLIHAMLASGLAVWKVGSGIIDAVRHEGGTRVILASSGVSSEVGAQILAPASGVSVRAPLPELVAAGIESAPVQSRSVETMLPALMMPVAAPVEVKPTEAAPKEPTSPTESALPAARTEPIDAALPRAREAVQAHEEAKASTPAADAPLPSAGVLERPTASRSEAIDLPRGERSVDRQRLAAKSESEAPSVRESSPAALVAPARSAESVSDVSLPRSAVVPVAMTEPAARSTSATAPEAAAAPVSGGSPELVRFDVKLPGAAVGAEATRVSSAMESASDPPSLAASLAPRQMATPAGAQKDAPLPAMPVVAPGRGGRASTEPAAASPEVMPLAPSYAAGVAPSAAVTSRPVVIAAPVRGGSGDAGVPGRLTDADPGAIERPTPAATMASGAAPAPARSADDLSGLRIPELPSGPVTPVETFAQRAPEVRGQVLEKMGGSAETERAVGLALEWFARHQETDGRWTGKGFDDRCGACGGASEFDADAAMTSMALLCYLGAGHTHQGDGPYREVVARGIRWLVQRQAPNGDLRRGETMYGQTVATVALCEALAMTGDQGLTDPARRAVAFVLGASARGAAGGDTAVLGWLVMAVESARRAGIKVPTDTFASAEKWLGYVSAPGTPGRYAYRKSDAPSVEMTAEAMFVRQLVGHARTEPMMIESARYVLSTPPKWTEGAPTLHWYYATLALFEHQGESWSAWNGALVPELVGHQRQDGAAAGSWDPQDRWSRMGGRIYQTAVCTLSLEVYYRYRPK